MATLAELEQREKELAEAEQENQTVVNQTIPQRRYGVKGVTKEQQQIYINRQQQAQSNLTQIQEQKKKIQEAKQQINNYQAQVAEYNRQKADLEQARRAAARARAGGNPGRLTDQQREYFNQIMDARRVELNQPDENTVMIEGIGGVSTAYPEQVAQKYAERGYTARTSTTIYTPIEPTVNNDIVNTPEGDYSVANEKQEDFYKQKSLTNNARQSRVLYDARVSQRDNVLRGVPNRVSTNSDSDSAGYQKDVLSVQNAPPRTKIQTLRAKGGASALLAGGLTAFKEPVDFAVGLVKRPAKTAKDTAVGTFNFGKRIVTGEGYPEIGQVLRDEPYYATGYAGGQVALFKAPEITVKGTDYVRTYNLKKIPTEEVVAPEFFKGQTFPLIKKGETAGELLAEFKTQLPGETKPAGFTASPVPFKKETTALKGSSEFPGVYQAPKLSPYFLRVSGEKEFKLLSFQITDTLRPSATRITPNEYKLAPGITASTSKVQPQKAKEIKRFFESEATKGTAYVTFIKTEKEAIIPFDTKLSRTDKRYYFNFEGRRIPIYEYKTAGADKTLNKITAYKAYSSSYANRIRRKGVINPYSSYVAVSKSYNSRLNSSYKSRLSDFRPLISLSKPRKSTISKDYYSIYNVPKSPSYPRPQETRPPRPPYYKPPTYRPPVRPPRIPPRGPPKKIVLPLNFSNKSNTNTKGFLTFIKRRGKFFALPGIRTRGEALLFGEKAAKRSLGATFKIKGTNQFVKGRQLNYTPNQRLFRNYKISRGKRIFTPDTFIQRRGKRLAYLPEIRELQRSRRRRKR